MCWSVLSLLLASMTFGTLTEGTGSFRVSGVVTGPDGRPASGTELVVASKEWGGEPPTILGRAEADEQGRFSIDLGTNECLCDQPTLWAYRRGSVTATAWLTRADVTGHPVDVVMGSPARAEFLVVGPGDNPSRTLESCPGGSLATISRSPESWRNGPA